MATDATPLFDGHIHYNRDVWAIYPPETAMARLDEAGIGRALVSSTPDQGTLKLYELAPERIVPVLRPYRSPADRGTWYRDPQVIEYLKQRLKLGVYRGIGEFHLYGRQANTPQIRQLVELAVERNLFLHAHSDESAIEILIAHSPRVRILWAHGGMTSPPESIDSLLGRHSNVWVELSYRYDDILSGDDLDPAWRELFLKYPDRFILGTDTWTAERWADALYITKTARSWIALLLDEVRVQFAFENVTRFLNQ
jgi:predicted TIM-barrel fold metal-dependent hydrolase